MWDMRRGGIPSLLITVVAALNVNLINSFRGSDVWTIVSVMGCIALVLSIFVIATPKIANKIVSCLENASFPSWMPYALLSAIVLIEGGFLAYRSRPVLVPTGDNIVLLTDLKWIKSEQSYKTPRMNKSVDDHELIAGNRIYRYGIGAHAESDIVMELPENADSLFVRAGIDAECYDEGSAIFIIKVDGKHVWRSSILRGRGNVEFANIPLQGASKLELMTDPNGPNNCDHTDWLNGYIKLR
jgi:hypothetical protein